MTRPIDLLRRGKRDELWQMCCGFIYLDTEQFMSIQRRLLTEQIELLKGSGLGRRLMRGAMPRTMEEFRQTVPLTTYEDYLPDLAEKREDGLPLKPGLWVHTIGRPGEYNVKRVPHTERFLREVEKVAGGMALLASCTPEGEYVAKEHMKTLATVGSRAYGSGLVGYMMKEALGCDFLPLEGQELPFQQRTQAGFEEALCHGLESCGGLSSILVYVGEMFRQGAVEIDTRFLLRHPRAAARYVRGLVRSRLAGRPILPKDLWSLKAVVGGGTDSALFHDRLEDLWGRRPLELYAGTEGGAYATQTWDYQSMTFIPNLNLLEFIPEREYYKWQLDRTYQPRTVLLDEVKAGECYEMVITNFHGGIMTRYRPGDMIRIVSLRNDTLGIATPQMVFERRADELVIIFGFGHLTERLVGEAIAGSGVPCVEWTARKEVIDGNPALRIYMEIDAGCITSGPSVAASVRAELERLDNIRHFNLHKYAYGDAVSFLGLEPVQVTLLPHGAFVRYAAQRRAEGAAWDQSRPPRINASDEVLSMLLAPKVMVEPVPAAEPDWVVAR